MKQKILMLQGPPGCGKTHLAEQMVAEAPGTWVRVNKDDIRADFARQGIGWSKATETKLVIPRRDELILLAIKAGKSVIVDDTNLAGAHETRLRALATWADLDFELKRLDVPLEFCIRRDAARAKPVGEEVVRMHYKAYERIVKATTSFVPTPVEYIPGLPDAVIFDLDGTLAERGDRGIYEFEKCADDTLKAPVAAVLAQFWHGAPCRPQIVFMSGREEKYRPQTIEFLEKHGISAGPLYMRATGDNRNDAIVKAELFNQHIRGKYNVLFAVDDRNRVVKMWRDLGLTCLQVADGDF